MPTIAQLENLGLAFEIKGDGSTDNAGFSVSGAGDVNGDGFDDIIVGAPVNDAGGNRAGAAYVIFGRSGGFGTIDLANLDTIDGFIIEGANALDGAGFEVSGLGDINGDGLDDFMIAASRVTFINDGELGHLIKAYVVFGKANQTSIDLSSLAASEGFVVNGPFVDGGTSFQLAGPADVNGDGLNDILISLQDDGSGGRSAYVIFGKTSGFEAIDVTNLADSAGFLIQGYGLGGTFDVAAADMNGDGFDEIVVSTVWQSINHEVSLTQAYVIFGKPTGFGDINLNSLGTSGFVIEGPETTLFDQWDVASAGDINGDGLDDIILGAPNAYLQHGVAYVIFGDAANTQDIDLSNLSPDVGFVIRGDASLQSRGISNVAGAGDVNGDGFDDLLIGDSGADAQGYSSGLVYLVFGKASGFETIDLSAITPADGFLVEGLAWNDNFGTSVSGAGDFNHDEYDDLIIGAPGVHSGRGAAYVIFGRDSFDLFSAMSDRTSDFNGDGRDDILWRHENGAVINWLGQRNGGFAANANANAGTDWRVAGVGDFNGDSRYDVLWRNISGAVTDWLGQPNGSFASNFGNSYYEVDTSWQVAGAGDFNGDGRDDILWRHDSGTVINWLGQGNGGFVSNANAHAGTDWQVAGVGDFNGDSRDDVLWRNVKTGELTDWLATPSGSFASNFEDAYYQVDLGWRVAGVGDFNGDGRYDILWRHYSGPVINWLGHGNGSFLSNTNAYAGTDWHVANIGDFNGDGRDDVLWRNDSGAVTDWLGQPNGSFASNFDNAYYDVDNNWQVQPSFDIGAGDWDY